MCYSAVMMAIRYVSWFRSLIINAKVIRLNIVRLQRNKIIHLAKRSIIPN